MFSSNARIKLNPSKIRQLSMAQIQSLEKTADSVMEDVKREQVLPFDKGYLKDHTFVDYSKSSKGEVSIHFSAPYARRLYYHPEFNFSKEEHKNAKGRWLDDYLEGGSKEDFARDRFKAFMRQSGGL